MDPVSVFFQQLGDFFGSIDSFITDFIRQLIAAILF